MTSNGFEKEPELVNCWGGIHSIRHPPYSHRSEMPARHRSSWSQGQGGPVDFTFAGPQPTSTIPCSTTPGQSGSTGSQIRTLPFGSGVHTCLGAPHARLIVRTLLAQLAELVSSIRFLSGQPKIEKTTDYERVNSFESLELRLNPK